MQDIKLQIMSALTVTCLCLWLLSLQFPQDTARSPQWRWTNQDDVSTTCAARCCRSRFLCCCRWTPPTATRSSPCARRCRSVDGPHWPFLERPLGSRLLFDASLCFRYGTTSASRLTSRGTVLPPRACRRWDGPSPRWSFTSLWKHTGRMSSAAPAT